MPAPTDAPDLDSNTLESRIEFARQIVWQQRERLEADLGRVESAWKPDGSRITETDHAISNAILGELAVTFPDDLGLSEELQIEAPLEVTSRFAWVLDPIDGTNNFASGMAECAIALGLFENGQPVYGVIYDAARRVLMHGGPGRGMWDGEREATVSGTPLSASSSVGFHSPRARGKYPGHGEAIVGRYKVRAMGSSALHLAYVAAGLLDGVVDHNVKIWDIAAAIPLLMAAGGELRFLSASPLPLRHFDLAMSSIVYVGGSAANAAELSRVLTDAHPVEF
ncbi:MAG: hypothetical protein SynsKO_27990 [Synoicihabitans sp.]